METNKSTECEDDLPNYRHEFICIIFVRLTQTNIIWKCGNYFVKKCRNYA